jgi:hypothetical protein
MAVFDWKKHADGHHPLPILLFRSASSSFQEFGQKILQTFGIVAGNQEFASTLIGIIAIPPPFIAYTATEVKLRGRLQTLG